MEHERKIQQKINMQIERRNMKLCPAAAKSAQPRRPISISCTRELHIKIRTHKTHLKYLGARRFSFSVRECAHIYTNKQREIAGGSARREIIYSAWFNKTNVTDCECMRILSCASAHRPLCLNKSCAECGGGGGSRAQLWDKKKVPRE